VLSIIVGYLIAGPLSGLDLSNADNGVAHK